MGISSVQESLFVDNLLNTFFWQDIAKKMKNLTKEAIIWKNPFGLYALHITLKNK